MLIRLQRLIQQEADPDDFLSSLAGGDDDGDDGDFEDLDAEDRHAGEGSPGAGAGPGQASGGASSAKAGAPGAAPGAGAGGPADNGGRDQVSNLNSALREVRGENKQLREQLSALTQRLDALAKPAAAEEPKEPDFLEDPAGKVAKLEQRLNESEKERKEREEKEKAQRQETERLQGEWNQVLETEQQFVATTPDYHDAVQHVRGMRIAAFRQEFEAMNDRAPTNQEVQQAITSQEIRGALALQAKGKNPAQWYYQYAQTLGYKPKAAPNPNPGADPAAAAGKPAAKPDKDAVRSMGSGGGEGARGEPPPARKSGLPELAAAHAERKEERKRSARHR